MSFPGVAAGSSYSYNDYYGSSDMIAFCKNEKRELSVKILTPRMLIKSVESKEKEYDNYAALFGDKAVMDKFSTGQTKTREEMQKRIDSVWVKRWKARDPYAGLSVFNRQTGDFMGHIVLGHSDQAGESEMAYLLHQRYWNQGYGSEAVMTLVKEYVPLAIKKGYSLGGKPLKRIVATVRPDNPASCRILQKVGMQLESTDEKYGAVRHHYSLDLCEIPKKTSKKVSESACILL